jgi:hypothetical protein
MQSQQQLPSPSRSDSPPNIINNNTLHHGINHLKSAPESLFNLQNTSHTLYNNVHIPPEYSDLDGQKQQQSKVNGFGAAAAGGPYRTSTAFNAFSNTRLRHQHAPGSSLQYRETGFNHGYTTAADVFPVQQMSSPTQHQQQATTTPHHFDIHQGRGFDFGVGAGSQTSVTASLTGHTKQSPYGLDPFGTNSASSALLQSHQVGGGIKQNNPPSVPPGLHPQPSQHQQSLDGYQHHQSQVQYLHLQSQTPYGPHLQTGGSGGVGGAPNGLPAPTGANGINGMNHLNGVNGSVQQNNVQEEISTIFVVGFPEDMQEREFQNMFTFSLGFEAATLKIPNKEYTAYGPGGNILPGNGTGSMGLRSGGMGFAQYGAGSNDPYNLVTVNQGGVVVDGGRDGTTASWPSSVNALPSVGGVGQDSILDSAANGHFGGPTQGQNAMMPPRKQIIGFAKFRSRQEALDARDVLQGRRVDIEKGAVLKAEMAKKNLHTKRGVGLMGVGVGGASGIAGMMGGTGGVGLVGGGLMNEALGALNLNGGLTGGGEVMCARERELGAVGAMGLNQWREQRGSIVENGMSREEEERERRREREAGALNAMGLGSGTRGPRERAEDDEREREKRRKDRLRSTNSTAFDAFHSVPPQPVSRAASNSLLSPTMSNGIVVGDNTGSTIGNTSPMLSSGFGHQMAQHSPNSQALDDFGSGLVMGPWDRKIGIGLPTSATLPSRPVSLSRPSSPPNTAPLSPSMSNNSLPSHPSLPMRPYSPSNETSQPQFGSNPGLATATSSSSVATSSASSNAGESHTGSEAENPKALVDLAVNTVSTGKVSPQLPSPDSSGSSGGAKSSAIDQNPPINTLYVGNLPTSQMPTGYPANYLEDSLRELFQRRPGFRKLCFRQKTNGPMCFVEFEDVNFAAKALNELYGNTLNGLIKGGGIRLSYSKNPLGVRTPTSAGGSGPTLQQQQQHNNALQQGLASPFPPDAFQPRQQSDFESRSALRRDMSNATSPLPSSYNYPTSPPPPRFFSPPPSSSSFSSTVGGDTSAFSRVNNYSFPPPSGQASMSNFSPFSISSPLHSHSNIPDQSSSELDDHFPLPHRALSPTANSIEVARAS